MSRRLHEGLLALALLAVGCSSSMGDTVTGGIALDHLEAEMIGALCNYYVLCGEMPDRATCLVSVNIQHPAITLDNKPMTLLGPLTTFFPTMKADVAAGRVAYDPKAAQDYVDAFNSLGSCEQIAVASVLDRAKIAYRTIFTRKLVLDDCYFDEECGADEFCRPSVTCDSEGCCPGHCSAGPQMVPAGGDCSHFPLEGMVCADGTICAGYPATCTPLLPAGATCGFNGACAEPYFCKSPDFGIQAGVCTAPQGRGETCGGWPAASPTCFDLRDTCVMNTHLCAARIPVGGACTGTFGDAECVYYAACSNSTCVAYRGAGESCGDGADACIYPLLCDATLHCVLPPARGSCR